VWWLIGARCQESTKQGDAAKHIEKQGHGQNRFTDDGNDVSFSCMCALNNQIIYSPYLEPLYALFVKNRYDV
jgi:hypothetical protein